jgi:DNA-binding transcriptional ArsR family regulator
LTAKAKGKRAPEIVDRRLAKALAHPVRVQILSVLSHRQISPVEFSREVGQPLSKVSYHFRVLEKFDCAEIVKTAQRRGSVEHFYRGTRRALFGDSDWKQLPKSVQGGVTSTILRTFLDRATEAIKAGTFDAREDRHFTWTPFVVDEEGWSELMSILESALVQATEVEVKASKRMAKSGADGIAMTVALAGFESPKAGPRPS